MAVETDTPLEIEIGELFKSYTKVYQLYGRYPCSINYSFLMVNYQIGESIW